MIYKVIAILILLAFHSCYGIKMLQQKKAGIQTDQLGKGKTDLPRIIENTLKICSFAIVIAELISVFFFDYENSKIIRVAGLIIACAGTLVFTKAVLDVKSNWRAGVSETDQTDLVTGGIYGWSRNPAFLGFDLMYIGVLMAFFNVPLLIITIITIVVFHLQIVNVEEDFLIVHFGREYIEYRNRVNRYFGKRAVRQ